MTEVFGPYERVEWNTMKALKEDISSMKKMGSDSRYKDAIEKEGNILKMFINREFV